MQLLSLLLCFEFIIAPVQGSLLINSALADDVKTCPAGQAYEASVNRCLTKNEVLKVNEATQSCGANQECYKNNAINALSDQGEGYSKDIETSGFKKAATAAAVAIPLVIVTSVLLEKSENMTGTKDKNNKIRGNAGGSGSKFECKPASLLLMYGAAAALAVGEIYGSINHASRLRKIKDEWHETVLPKEGSGTDKKRAEATEAQSQAFEFLARNEEQVGKTAKTKKGFYIAATGLFAAGAGAAALEMIQLGAARTKLLKAQVQLKAATLSPDPNTKATIPGLKLQINQHTTTIKRLTCFQEVTSNGVDENGKATYDKDGKVDENGRTQSELDDEVKTNEKKLATEKSEEDNTQKEINRLQAAKDARNAEQDKLTPNSPEALQRKAERDLKAKQDDEKLEKLLREQQDKQNKKLLEGLDHDNASNTQGTVGSISNSEKLKMKQVAAYNLSTAKNAEQYLNLMKEYESIEFENYSQVRYVEEDPSLQKIEFSPFIAKMIAETLIPQAHAQGGSMVTGLVGTMAMPMLGQLKGIMNGFKFNGGKPMNSKELNDIKSRSTNFIIRAIGKPVTRLAINGVLGGWTGLVMVPHMNKQQHLAQDRAKKLRSMKEDFVTANGLLFCTEEDRQNTEKPKCYCYTPENKMNPSRSGSAVCKNAIAGLSNKANDTTSDKVCVTTAMAMDSTCACRSTNTCLKTTAGFSSMGFTPNTFKMISANSGPANDLFNGNVGAGDIADSAGINAARTQAAAANAIAGDAAAVKESKAAADAFEKGMLATTSGLSMGSGSGSSPLPTTPAAAAAALDKEIEKNNEDINVTDSGKSGFSATSSSDEPVPEFGMTPTDAANQEIEIAEVMGKEVDFGSNDINKAKDTNLFETLSNRYQRSGMRRLFEEGKPAPADAPAKTDISN